MIKIKLSTQFPNWPLFRQTPGSKGIWEDCQFFVNQDIEECDYWVVCGGLLNPEKAICLQKNTIFITWEPPSVHKYDKHFLNQFATIITCHRDIKHPCIIHTQQGLPWMIGGKFLGDGWDEKFSKDYDELKSIEKYNKNKLISVIVSSKSYTKGHIKRLQFVKRLKAYFGDKLDVFGVGNQKIEDKWDAIAQYKYHIVIENSSINDYWTEKLSDAFLGGAYPFYYGCPNLSDYFSKDCFTFIDIDYFDKSVALIEDIIKNQRYEKSIVKIAEAKNLILDKYNLFSLICNYCNSNTLSSSYINIILKPEYDFNQKLGVKLFRYIKNIHHKISR